MTLKINVDIHMQLYFITSHHEHCP